MMSGNRQSGPDAGEPDAGASAAAAPGRVLVVADEVNQRSALARMLGLWG